MNKGTEAEVLFDLEVTKRGCNVCRPLSDIGYDRIVEYRGKMARVQIKMTTVRHRRGFTARTHRRSGESYEKHADFFAIYIKPIDEWMIIPVSHIKGQRIKLNVAGITKQYLNDWNAFKKRRYKKRVVQG